MFTFPFKPVVAAEVEATVDADVDTVEAMEPVVAVGVDTVAGVDVAGDAVDVAEVAEVVDVVAGFWQA